MDPKPEESKQLAKTSDTVKNWLLGNKAQLEMALPAHIPVDRMIRVALTSLQKNVTLQECSPVSLIGAIIQCAQLGLEPDDGTGKAYLVPFWNTKKNRREVQFIPGYKGLIDLARRSGQLTIIEARTVRKGDKFEYEFGLNPKLVHLPNSDSPGAPATHFYAIAEFSNKSRQFDVMTLHEVNKIRDRSKAKDSGPWVTDPEEMGKKTVLRRLCKLLPASPELLKAVTLDERAELGMPQDLAILADEQETGTPQEEVVSKPSGHDRIINEGEFKLLCARADAAGVEKDEVSIWIKQKFGKLHRKELTVSELTEVLNWIKSSTEPTEK